MASKIEQELYDRHQRGFLADNEVKKFRVSDKTREQLAPMFSLGKYRSMALPYGSLELDIVKAFKKEALPMEKLHSYAYGTFTDPIYGGMTSGDKNLFYASNFRLILTSARYTLAFPWIYFEEIRAAKSNIFSGKSFFCAWYAPVPEGKRKLYKRELHIFEIRLAETAPDFSFYLLNACRSAKTANRGW